MKRSVARELRVRMAAAGVLAAGGLLVFVVFDIDRIFDARYQQSGGLAYEIADHVVLPLIVVLLPIMLAMRWAVGRSLAPLEIAARRINEASGQQRGFRVRLDGLPMEAVPFARAVNDLLARLDEAAERQEAFAADIAHEFKTPLAILGLELEGYDDPLGRKLRADISSMNRLVDQLLLIAQLDAQASARVSYEAVALRNVAAEVSSRLARSVLRAGKKLELVVLDDPVVEGRPEAIAAALRNLVENALRVTGPGEAVRLVVGPGRQLRVQDCGPGLTKDRLESLSHRLKRADNASTEGAGLGLSIVKKIMSSHDGALETDPVQRELRMVFP